MVVVAIHAVCWFVVASLSRVPACWTQVILFRSSGLYAGVRYTSCTEDCSKRHRITRSNLGASQAIQNLYRPHKRADSGCLILGPAASAFHKDAVN